MKKLIFFVIVSVCTLSNNVQANPFLGKWKTRINKNSIGNNSFVIFNKTGKTVTGEIKGIKSKIKYQFRGIYNQHKLQLTGVILVTEQKKIYYGSFSFLNSKEITGKFSASANDSLSLYASLIKSTSYEYTKLLYTVGNPFSGKWQITKHTDKNFPKKHTATIKFYKKGGYIKGKLSGFRANRDYHFKGSYNKWNRRLVGNWYVRNNKYDLAVPGYIQLTDKGQMEGVFQNFHRTIKFSGKQVLKDGGEKIECPGRMIYNPLQGKCQCPEHTHFKYGKCRRNRH
ncbi:MAG: hypothetical protein JXR95_11920 [Deltaproteobacteria bacterium]|nr:hypothetical protein [Deltaproteobacteria bacterium]